MHNSTGYVIKQLVHAFSCALSSYGARGKFGEHERSVRVARSNSKLVKKPAIAKKLAMAKKLAIAKKLARAKKLELPSAIASGNSYASFVLSKLPTYSITR